MARSGFLGHAVLDRVLDERLQQERGQQRIERLGFDVEPHDQSIGESRLLDFEVLREEIELRLQRAFVLAQVLERHAEQIAEAHQRAIRGVDVAMHQRRNRVQRVEQEVRLQLMLQRGHLRLDELGLELGRRAARGRATRGNRGPRG